MRLNVKLGKWLLHYEGKLKFYKMIPDLIGLQSLTNDNKHVLFLDFDKKKLTTVEKLCRNIQIKYSLGSFYIFKSSIGNYHAIALDKLSFGKVADIQLDLGMDKYLMFAAIRKFWVLRVSPKSEPIKYIKCIHSHGLYPCSNAHYEFLKNLYPQINVKPHWLDDSKGLKVDIYTSVTKEK